MQWISSKQRRRSFVSVRSVAHRRVAASARRCDRQHAVSVEPHGKSIIVEIVNIAQRRKPEHAEQW
jgi:hypothetical protein